MDRLAGAALALALLVTSAAAYDRWANVSLSRAEWSCSKSHDETRIRYSADPENRPVAFTVVVPVCDGWVRR